MREKVRLAQRRSWRFACRCEIPRAGGGIKKLHAGGGGVRGGTLIQALLVIGDVGHHQACVDERAREEKRGGGDGLGEGAVAPVPPTKSKSPD